MQLPTNDEQYPKYYRDPKMLPRWQGSEEGGT